MKSFRDAWSLRISVRCFWSWSISSSSSELRGTVNVVGTSLPPSGIRRRAGRRENGVGEMGDRRGPIRFRVAGVEVGGEGCPVVGGLGHGGFDVGHGDRLDVLLR